MNKLADQWNNNYYLNYQYQLSKPVDADYSALTDKAKLGHKVPEFKVGNRVY